MPLVSKFWLHVNSEVAGTYVYDYLHHHVNDSLWYFFAGIDYSKTTEQ